MAIARLLPGSKFCAAALIPPLKECEGECEKLAALGLKFGGRPLGCDCAGDAMFGVWGTERCEAAGDPTPADACEGVPGAPPLLLIAFAGM